MNRRAAAYVIGGPTRIFRYLLIPLAVTVLAAGGPATPAAQAAEANIVFAALQALVDNHVDNPDPVRLLAAALGGLRQALQRAGVGADLPDLTATDEAGARAQFQERFDVAASLAAGRLDEPALQYSAAAAMAVSFGDSHTRFFRPDEFAAFLRSLQGQAGFSGVGTISAQREGRFYFIYVVPDGPADRAGVRRFDRVLAVDGANTEGMTAQDFAGRVRGPEGTTVVLTILRPGENEARMISIVRAPIALPAVDVVTFAEGVAHVRFLAFSRGAAARLSRIIQDLQAQGMRALVLDVRSNSGGFIDELDRALSFFLPSGTLAYIDQDRRGMIRRLTGDPPILPPPFPMVLVTDTGSASAAEVFSAGMRDNGRAQIVGLRTRGAVQRTRHITLPGNAGIGVPVARVFSPKGVDLEGSGVTPDVEVDLRAEDLDRGVDTQIARATQQVLQPAAVAP